MAGFLSSILGSEVSASTDTLNSDQENKNSQTMSLLQANVSSASIFKDLKTKDGKGDEIDTGSNVNIVSDDALLSSTSPISISGNDVEEFFPDQISVHVVKKGDSLSAVAKVFGVSVDTILAANDMKKGDKLKEGDILIILPISGIEHTVIKGQTLQGIAKLYKVDVSDIVNYNGILDTTKLAIGDKLMIPGGEMIDTEVQKPKTNSINTIKKTLEILVGYFTNPVPGYKRVSQRLHGNNSVDLAAPTGTPIVASASGTVLFARKGYNGGYGNMVIVNHPNGTQTLYAHQSKILTHTGAEVNKGETIGYVGSTGHSTGPHLHFEVHGARNPAVDL